MSDTTEKRHLFYKVKPPAGSRPGTLAIPPGSPLPEFFLFRYAGEHCEEGPVEDVAAIPEPGEGVTWIDVRGLGDEASLRAIGERFGLHPLALEDAVNVPQRAKSAAYPEHQVIVMRMPLAEPDGSITVPQVCFVLGEGYLLTFQERYFGFFDAVRERIRAGNQRIRGFGADYLCYALIDTLVDLYYPIAERLSEELEELEDEVNEAAAQDTISAIHRVRRQLVVLRRVGRPQREVLNSLLRDKTRFVSDETRTYLRDTHDHFAQIMELVDSSREMAMGLTEIYLSEVSHRTNEIMKVLTLMASIFIPLTFIAGVYGMNFEFMPELRVAIAYPMVLGTMVVVALAMVGYFRYRGWLGSPRRRRRPPDAR